MRALEDGVSAALNLGDRVEDVLTEHRVARVLDPAVAAGKAAGLRVEIPSADCAARAWRP